MAFIRDPIDEPRLFSDGHDYLDSHFIKFIHPGYGNAGDDPAVHTLISLEAFDDGGVHYDTAHTACAILAGNRWDGYLSTDKHGIIKVRPVDGILRGRNYYFCLPSSDPSTDQYPVIPRFADWRFPHDNLPPLWKRYKDQLRADRLESQAISGHCSLSNYGNAIQQAHLVPVKQDHWWRLNRMSDYTRLSLFSTDPINAPANWLPLRSDIHQMLDERNFTFVPKTDDSGKEEKVASPQRHDGSQREDDRSTRSGSRPDVDGNRACHGDSQLTIRSHTENQSLTAETEPRVQAIPYLVGHVFNSTTCGQLPQMWHNRRVHTLPSPVSVECLFARFAWTVFSPMVFREFLINGKARKVLIWNHDLQKHEIEEADPERCRSIFKAARSRSESPQKRPRPGGNEQRDNDEQEAVSAPGPYDAASDVDSAYHGDSQLSGEDALDSSILDEPERGRRKKRKSEENCDIVSDMYGCHGVKRTRVDPLA